MPPKKRIDEDAKSLGSAGGATVATEATCDTKLSAESLKAGTAEIEGGGLGDDVSILGMEQGSLEHGSIESADMGGPDGPGDERVEEEEEEEEEDGDEDEEEEEEEKGTRVSGLTKDSGETKKKQGGIGGFLKKLKPTKALPKVTSTRRFSIDGIRMFAKKEVQNDLTLNPYVPAIKFHERMSKRREKFKRKKEEVADNVMNAEHNKFSLESNMKTF